MIVDDQELVRSGIEMILTRAPDITVVGQAVDGRDMLDALERARPDVILMDIRMPRLDGVAATEAIMSLPDPPKVMILTTFDLDEHVFAALRAGAAAFLLKDTPGDALVDAIRTVASGQSLLHPAVTRRVIAHFVAHQPLQDGAEALTWLTERERDVLLDIARGFSNAEIGARRHLGEATVKTHVSRVLAKLSLRDRTQAVVWAYEHGVVVPGHTGSGSS
jgi:DNA-binding NarL/FixJ family response regulator